MAHLPAPRRLHTTTGAPNPRRLALVAALKKITLPATEEVSIMGGASREPAFVAKTDGHPGLPILELEDGTILSESTAIARYLEALHPEPNLFGRDAREAAVIEMWTRRVELGLFQEIRAAFRHLHPRMKIIEDQIPLWGEANKPRALASLALIDRRLAQSPWLAGERLTFADVELLTSIEFMRMARIDVPAGLSALARWRAAMEAALSA